MMVGREVLLRVEKKAPDVGDVLLRHFSTIGTLLPERL